MQQRYVSARMGYFQNMDQAIFSFSQNYNLRLIMSHVSAKYQASVVLHVWVRQYWFFFCAFLLLTWNSSNMPENSRFTCIRRAYKDRLRYDYKWWISTMQPQPERAIHNVTGACYIDHHYKHMVNLKQMHSQAGNSMQEIVNISRAIYDLCRKYVA